MRNLVLVKCLVGAAVCGSILLGGAGPASATLLHRYSFNDATVNDSVGSAHGALVGSATISGGFLVTPGANPNQGAYASLPASVGAGITGDFTIEDFIIDSSNQTNFSSLYSFGIDAFNFILVNPARVGSGNLTGDFRQGPGASETNLDAGPYPFGPNEHMVTLTYVAATNTASIYLDGALMSSSVTASPTGINFQTLATGGAVGIGGNAPFSDPGFNGSTDELRIYDSALSTAQIGADSSAGPDSVIATPEPASLSLAAIGAVGFVALLRKCARAA